MDPLSGLACNWGQQARQSFAIYIYFLVYLLAEHEGVAKTEKMVIHEYMRDS